MATEQQVALQGVISNLKGAYPDAYEVLDSTVKETKESFDYSKAVKVGDKLPQFRLLDTSGAEVSRDDLLKHGTLLVTFYRGSWCPYCDVVVQHLQRHLEEFKARGVTLIAISPEKPDYSLSTAEKHALQFPVLTDLHNELARKLGIVYDHSWAREFHGQLGIDLNARNGEDTWETPVPTTLLVDKSGIVRNVHLEVDFRDRLEPKTALGWADKLNGQ